MSSNEILDILCIGFGPTALSLAIGLEEQSPHQNVLFLERNNQFHWKGAEFPIGKTSMRTNFMHDLVTSRNPSSRYTFVNYLWSTNMLVMFTNLSAMNPPRRLFNDYLIWVAKHFESQNKVKYDQNITSIEPLTNNRGQVEAYKVLAKDSIGNLDTYHTRKIVLATGSEQHLPDWALHDSFQGKLFHSSQFGRVLPVIQKSERSTVNVAIIGTDIEAFEVLSQCQSLSNVKTTLIQDEKIRDNSTSILFPDLSTNEIDNKPSHHVIDEQFRKYYSQLLRQHKNSNVQYTTLNNQNIHGVSKLFDQLIIEKSTRGNDNIQQQSGPFDFVFISSGYHGKQNLNLLKSFSDIMEHMNGKLLIDDSQKIHTKPESVIDESGIWITSDYNGTDNIFPLLALKVKKVLDSLIPQTSNLSNKQEKSNYISKESNNNYHIQARL